MRLSDSRQLCSMMYFSASIIAVETGYNILSFCRWLYCFVHLWIDWVLGFSFLSFFFFVFMSFLNKSINDLKLWWVCLSVHFCLFFIWNSRFCWSVFGFGSMSWKCTQCLIKQKKFSASVYSCFFLYFLVVGTESRFLFKSVRYLKRVNVFINL